MGPVIDLTTLFPWRIIAVFADSFSAYVIAHSRTKDKWHPALTFLAIFVVRVITSVLFYNNEMLNAIGYLIFSLANVLVLSLFTYGRLPGKILCAVMHLVSSFLATCIMALVSGVIYGNRDFEQIFGENDYRLTHLYLYLIRCVVMIVCGFLVAGILRLLTAKKNKKQRRNKSFFVYLTFFPLSHIFVIVLAFLIAPIDYETQTFSFGTSIMVIVLMLLIMVFDCFYPFILDRFERLTLENEEKEKRLLKNELDYQQVKLLSAEKDEFRKLRHDFKNILATAQGFIELDQPDKALQIIKKTQKDLSSVSGIVLCANSILNVVLSVAKQKADAQGIAFHVLVKESAVLKLDDYLVCRLMHNLLDNALEAAAAAAEKSVAVHIWIDAACFDIAVQNTCTSEEKRTKRSGDHGHGTAIIRQIVKQYMGTYTVTAENGTYLAKVQLSNASFSDE